MNHKSQKLRDLLRQITIKPSKDKNRGFIAFDKSLSNTNRALGICPQLDRKRSWWCTPEITAIAKWKQEDQCQIPAYVSALYASLY